jgi:type I restriction enzyme S subunit
LKNWETSQAPKLLTFDNVRVENFQPLQFQPVNDKTTVGVENLQPLWENIKNNDTKATTRVATWLSLDKVCIAITAGGDLPKNFAKGQKTSSIEFPYPIYSNGKDENAIYGYTDGYKIVEDAVTISARGTIGWHTVRNGKFTPIVRLITLIANKDIITTKYLNYVLDITEISGTDGGIPQLTVPNVKTLKIPIPPIAEQNRIVSILDRFDTLVNDLTVGLPAEISARRQQYEYYRNKLLTFKEVKYG